jgi:hypothetical protein
LLVVLSHSPIFLVVLDLTLHVFIFLEWENWSVGKKFPAMQPRAIRLWQQEGFFSYEAENTKTCVPLHRSMRTAMLVERPPITLAGCVLWLAFAVLRGTNRRRGLLHR